MNPEIEKIVRSKQATRIRLAALSFSEKVRLLERMRERDTVLGSKLTNPEGKAPRRHDSIFEP